jgi:hypothetical protein
MIETFSDTYLSMLKILNSHRHVQLAPALSPTVPKGASGSLLLPWKRSTIGQMGRAIEPSPKSMEQLHYLCTMLLQSSAHAGPISYLSSLQLPGPSLFPTIGGRLCRRSRHSRLLLRAGPLVARRATILALPICCSGDSQIGSL